MYEDKSYLNIVSHYEDCLAQHGDSHLGVDWINKADAEKRYRVMLEIIQNKDKSTLLDFGCGASHLLEYIKHNNISNIDYSGLDISPKFIKISKQKFPDINFFNIDILESKTSLENYDYIIMNGVFTEKRNLSFGQMFDYFCAVIKKIYPYCNKGIAFNIRSKQVEHEEDDLFHLSLDKLADFLTKEITTSYIIRNDYGLFEYTVYLYPRKNI